MRNKRLAIAVFGALLLSSMCSMQARAIPLFAQRYRLACGACHSVLPELNSFGTYFREHGYRLPAQRHGTTGIAIRYQVEYEQDPGTARRFAPGGVLLSNADIGKVSAFIHYNLGAGGGPSGLYLGYLASYDEHTHSLYRLGLFELPLAQSPGQRLDDLAPYGYYATRVGLNDLALSAPRWGAQLERTIGVAMFDATISLGEFKGSAYGGKPVITGETTTAAAPEFALFARTPITNDLTLGGELISGARRITPVGRPSFTDGYTRGGLLGRFERGRFELQGEQWWGRDADADGFGSVVGSSGGYLRLKYYPTQHAYLGIRYDAAANPVVARDIVYYGALHVTPHARVVLQRVQTIGGSGHFGAALTVGFPWPANL